MKRGAFLFDLDGTLINTLPDIAGVVNRVRADFGLQSWPKERMALHIGKGAEVLVKGCFPGIVLESTELIQRFRDRYYQEPHHGGHVYPDVLATLTVLRSRGFLLGIATNKPERAARVTLSHYLPNFAFDVIACPENVSEKKPSPKHLLEPLNKLGISPGLAVFVGDDPVDWVAATRAGVRFLGVAFGFGGVKAPNQIESFGEILDYLATLP